MIFIAIFTVLERSIEKIGGLILPLSMISGFLAGISFTWILRLEIGNSKPNSKTKSQKERKEKVGARTKEPFWKMVLERIATETWNFGTPYYKP
jgi:hypothetical protein